MKHFEKMDSHKKVEKFILEISEAHSDIFPLDDVKKGLFAINWIKHHKFENHPDLPTINEIKQWIKTCNQ